MSLASCWRFPLTLVLVPTTPRFNHRHPTGSSSRRSRAPAQAQLELTVPEDGPNDDKKVKKVVVVGSGWAGLGAAHHLCNQQGFDVTVLETTDTGLDDVGVHGNYHQLLFFTFAFLLLFVLIYQLGSADNVHFFIYFDRVFHLFFTETVSFFTWLDSDKL